MQNDRANGFSRLTSIIFHSAVGSAATCGIRVLTSGTKHTVQGSLQPSFLERGGEGGAERELAHRICAETILV